ncbi:MAG: chemotaxis protein CheD, partial [Methanomicrobiales archaeon]|nr:chemotaxis protein CheD [Methanomicrobiales archaeon]
MTPTVLASSSTDVIGIGDYRVGSTVMASIGLGSCIGLVIHDRKRGCGGLAHIMLPCANGRNEHPGKYADSAPKILVEDLCAQGSRKNSLVAKFVGGAQMFPGFSAGLNIGARNIETVREALTREGICIGAEDVGGSVGRSVIYHP